MIRKWTETSLSGNSKQFVSPPCFKADWMVREYLNGRRIKCQSTSLAGDHTWKLFSTLLREGNTNLLLHLSLFVTNGGSQLHSDSKKQFSYVFIIKCCMYFTLAMFCIRNFKGYVLHYYRLYMFCIRLFYDF